MSLSPMKNNTSSNLSSPVTSSKGPATPSTDKKTGKVINLMMSSPSTPYNPGKGGPLSLCEIVTKSDPADILSRGIEKTLKRKIDPSIPKTEPEDDWQQIVSPSAKKTKKLHEARELIDHKDFLECQEQILAEIGKLAGINESYSITALKVNDLQLAIQDRT